MKLFASKIDRLEDTQKRLERSLEKKKSSVAFSNSRLEAKIKRLEEEAFRNRVDLDKYASEIALRLDRNATLIKAEAEYAKQLGDKYINKKVGK